MSSSTTSSSTSSTISVVASTLGVLATSATIYHILQKQWNRQRRSKKMEYAIYEQWQQSGRKISIDENDDDEEDNKSSKSDDQEEDIIIEGVKKDETLPAIWEVFKDFQLDYDCSISEANKRRTSKYYELSRDAHLYELCPGVRSYPRLRNRREAELKRIFRYHHANLRHPDRAKSHRTIIVMCDPTTTTLLGEARTSILEPLQFSHDITTSNVWIPAANV